jgi:methionyl-tRNA formyltransferase
MRIVMMGTGTFAEPTFEALISNFGGDVVGLVTQPERDGGNKRGSTRQTGKGMANIAKAAAIATVQPESINTPDGLALLHAMEPDLLVVAAYGQILSKAVLAAPKIGTINVHASLLPKYRGAAPVAYAIWKGETRTGVSIIKVTPGLDSGDILLQDAIEIGDQETSGELESRLAVLGAKLAVDVVKRIGSEGFFAGVKQDPALVTKAPKLTKEAGLIDWSKPAEEVCRQVRAMQPWPTAYTYLRRPGRDSLRLIVVEAQPTESFTGPVINKPFGEPYILDQDRTQICVNVSSRQMVGIKILQPAGKKPMKVEEFLRGHPITDGMSFGPEVLS